MSNYTAPAAPTATPAAPSSNPPPSQSGGGGPYLPRQAVLGGRPSTDLDVPICAVFLLLFIAGATFNMTIFQINRKHGYKFLFSGLLFGFCMARIVALCTRMAWAAHDTNIKIAIASQIFTAAGVILLFVTNLIFAQRIIRAYHPFFGWSKPVSLLFKVLYVSIVAVLILVITVTVHSFFTLDPDAKRADRIVQLFCGTYMATVAFLPIPLALTAVIIPRRTRIDKFGQGHFSTKFGLLLFTAALLATGAIFRAVTNFYVRPVQDPAWFQSKACYYTFNFGIEVLVVYTYALSRFDKRFHIPDGSSAPGHYSCSEDSNLKSQGHSPARSARTSAASLSFGKEREIGRRSYHAHGGYGGYRGHHRGGNMGGGLSDLDKDNSTLKYPASAHLRNSKRVSVWSDYSRKTGSRSSGIPPLNGTSMKSSGAAGVGYGYGGVNAARSVRSAPRSVRSLYYPSAPDAGVGAARSEADVANMEADMEWMARAMRELYGDDEVAESSSKERRSYGHHRDKI
ncbi:Protein of unknown function (DUF3112) domain containing protein [Naviculisporaceae sp. PSN 640]